MENLTLIYPDIVYKEELEEYIEDFKKRGEVIHGGADIHYKDSIEAWIESCKNNRTREGVEKNLQPSSSFLLIGQDERLLGLLNLRHSLNDFLLRRGGHIGYSIKPSERGKGYGSEILRLGLVEARKLGLEKVLLTCDSKNIASRKIILKHGGIYESSVEVKTGIIERYWIDLGF